MQGVSMPTETWKLNWSKLIVLNHENVGKLDDVEGVYRVSKSEGDRVLVFYVGRGNIKERLLYHLSDVESNECVKSTIQAHHCFFRYSIIKQEQVRKAAERKLYRVYAPQCNSVLPDGSDDIVVNLE